MKKTIIVFSPHNDDLEIAMGGTALRYIKEGYSIIKVIFSIGELSNPHLKESYVTKEREKQALEVEKEFGLYKTIFFRLTDARIVHEIEIVRDDIEALLRKYKPEK